MKMPFPVTYRELWVPGHINGTQLAPFKAAAHPLTLTGARLGTTADGVKFIRGANSEISLGVIHNSQAQLWISLRFKLNQTFAAASATAYLWTKRVDADNRLELYLDTADGMITLQHREAAVTLFTIKSVAASWTGGTWYHVLFSISNTAGARLIANNAAAVTNADLTAAPAGGAIIVGDQAVAGAVGISGIITDIIMGTDNLTATEEDDLYRGDPPNDAVHVYTCDEGRGTTANDRGSGANNGTLGSAASWAFGQVRQSVLSLDGINDYARQTANIQIDNNMTLVYVAKWKCSNPSGLMRHAYWRIGGTGFNRIIISHSGGSLSVLVGGAAVSGSSSLSAPTIDDYSILLVTTSPTLESTYLNGTLVSSAAIDRMLPNLGELAIGDQANAPNGEASFNKVLMAADIEGVFTAKQALSYSRWLRDIFNLPISI